VALSDEASGDAGDSHGGEVDDDDDEAVYGKPIKYTYANTNKNSKDNKWSNRRAGSSNSLGVDFTNVAFSPVFFCHTLFANKIQWFWHTAHKFCKF